MDRTERVVRIARRRLKAGVLIDRAGRGLAWGSAAALVWVCGSKLLSFPGQWWWAGGVLAAGGAIGLATALWRRGTDLEAAGEVDRRLRLKDRLATGTVFRDLPTPAGAFASLAVDEAERASAAIDPRRAVPIVWGRTWKVWPVVAAAAAIIGVWAPAFDAGHSARQRAVAEAAAREALRKQIAEAARETPALPPASTPGPKQDAAAADAVLTEIERELAAGKVSPSQAAERGAGELEKIAAQRDRVAQEEQEKHDALRDTLARMNAQESRPSSTRDTRLGSALKDGDFSAATEAAREMLNTASDQSAADRARAAEELRKLAEDIRAAEAAREAAQASTKSEPADRRTSIERAKTSSAPADAETKSPANTNSDQSPSTSAAKDLAAAMERAAEQLRNQPPVSKPTERSERQSSPGRSASQQPSPADGRPEQTKDGSAAGHGESRSTQEDGRSSQPPLPRDASPQPGKQTDGSPAKPPQPQRQGADQGGEGTPRAGVAGDAGSQERANSTQATPSSPSDRNAPTSSKTDPAGKGSSEQSRPEGQQPGSGSAAPGTPSGSSEAGRPAPQRERAHASEQKSEGARQPSPESAPASKSTQPSASEPARDHGSQGSESRSSPPPSKEGEKPAGASEQSGPEQAERRDGVGERGTAAAPKDGGPSNSNPTERSASGTPSEHSSSSPAADATPRESPSPSGTARKESTGSQTSPRHNSGPDPQSQSSESPSSAHPGESPRASAQPQGSPRSNATQPENRESPGAGQTSSQQRSGESSRSQPADTGTQPAASDAPKNGDAGGRGHPSATPEPDAPPTPGSRPTPGGGQSNPATPGSDPSSTAPAMKDLVDQLERLSKQPRDAEQSRRQAEQFRKQAQEMLKHASPEQIEQAKRWAKDLSKKDGKAGGNGLGMPGTGASGGDPSGQRTGNPIRADDAIQTRTETVDARPGRASDPPRERVLAEWYSDKKPTSGERPATSLTPEAETSLRDAVRDGEHAVDTESVPTRYDKLLRRYFQRLGDRAKGASPSSSKDAAGTSPTPAVPAQDAPSGPAPHP